MALCRTCAAILNRTISSPSLPLTRTSSAVILIESQPQTVFCRHASHRSFVIKLNPHRTLTVQHHRELQQQLRDLHQYHQRQSPHPSEEKTTLINDDDTLKISTSRPKSFKELVEMRKRGTQKKKSLWSMSPEEKARALADEESLEVDGKAAPEPPSSGPLRHFDQLFRAVRRHKLYQSVRRQIRYYSRLYEEINVHIDEKINQQCPGFKNKAMRKEADLTKRLNESNLVMYATQKEMFFYGHPFRGAAMISSLFPVIGALQFDNAATRFVLPIYILGFWYFYLRKLVRAVWYDQDKDLFSIYIPYKAFFPITFKPGHVTEIDELLANVNIRGETKVFCPRGLFKSADDYHKMFKYDRQGKKS